MFSAIKHQDRLMLEEIADTILFLTKHLDKPGIFDSLEGYGVAYEKLQERINTHDYTEDDATEARVMSYLNK